MRPFWGPGPTRSVSSPPPPPGNCTPITPWGTQVNPKTPTVVEWNYFIEQQLTQNMSIRVGYVGAHAYHNIIDIDGKTTGHQICSDPNGCLARVLRATVGD